MRPSAQAFAADSCSDLLVFLLDMNNAPFVIDSVFISLSLIKGAYHTGKKFGFLMFGGAEGNRTPVRKQLGKNLSGRSLLFTFPHPGGNKHPTGIGSFMMHGMRKA